MKTALVGYGYWGSNLMRCFSRAKGCELIVCCEPDPSRHEEIRERYPNVQHIDATLDQTLNRDDIEAVVLATPAGSHFEQTKAALLSGKHVFVEKPLATNLRDATELVEIAAKQNRKLLVGHTFIYNDAVRWVKDFINQGELGEIYYVYLQRLALGRVRQDVDALWNLAPHDISIVNYWFDEQPTEVTATGTSFLQEGIDDISFLSMRFPSGKFANIHVSWLDPSKTRKAVLVGSNKMVVYDDTMLDEKITVYDKGVDRKTIGQSPSNQRFDTYHQFSLIQRAGDILIPKIKFREPLEVEAQHFVDVITKGETPITDGLSGQAVVAVLEAAMESRKLGKSVSLKPLNSNT